MIWLVVQNSHCTVELFGEYHSYHLVRECHLAERNLLVCGSVDGRRESVRSSDNEDESLAAGIHLLFEPLCKLYASAFCSGFVEKDNIVAGLNGLQYLLAFLFFLLFFGKILRILQLGDYDHLEAHIMLDSADVFISRGYEMLVNRLSYDLKYCFHVIIKSFFSDIII